MIAFPNSKRDRSLHFHRNLCDRGLILTTFDSFITPAQANAIKIGRSPKNNG
ncbi:hypothetical protein [Microcoleus sp. F4-D5]|uniref:hypothetical protein n=1 Tax=Microcoleus sp. F4-D5 TaxID=2818760 RepID=UPI002FD3A1C8